MKFKMRCNLVFCGWTDFEQRKKINDFVEIVCLRESRGRQRAFRRLLHQGRETNASQVSLLQGVAFRPSNKQVAEVLVESELNEMKNASNYSARWPLEKHNM